MASGVGGMGIHWAPSARVRTCLMELSARSSGDFAAYFPALGGRIQSEPRSPPGTWPTAERLRNREKRHPAGAGPRSHPHERHNHRRSPRPGNTPPLRRPDKGATSGLVLGTCGVRHREKHRRYRAGRRAARFSCEGSRHDQSPGPGRAYARCGFRGVRPASESQESDESARETLVTRHKHRPCRQAPAGAASGDDLLHIDPRYIRALSAPTQTGVAVGDGSTVSGS